MVWKIVLVVAAFVLLKMLFNRTTQMSVADARAKLKEGALLIDVRTAGEFASRHLPGAINLALDDLDAKLLRRVKDKNQVLLLHCQSGMRSGVAMKKAKALGYANVFNIGSYSRAEKIVEA